MGGLRARRIIVLFSAVAAVSPVGCERATSPPTAGSAPRTFLTLSNPNEILDVTVGPDGRVWTAGPGGVTAWSEEGSERLTVDDGLPSNAATAVRVAPDGTLVVGTADGGVGTFDGDRWRIARPGQGLPLTGVSALAIGPDGQIYASGRQITDRGGGSAVAVSVGGRWRLLATLPGDHATSVAVAPNGDVWASTFDAGVARIVGHDVTVFREQDGLGYDYVRDVTVAPDGVVWFATSSQVAAFDGTSWHVSKPGHTGVCESIATGAEGTVWCGGPFPQINRFEAGSWVSFPVSPPGEAAPAIDDPMSADGVSSVTVANDGTVWAGTWARGLISYRDGTWERRTGASEPPRNDVTVLQTDGDVVWAGLPGALSRLEDDEWSTYDAPGYGTINDLVIGPSHEIYASSEGGVARLDDGTWSLVQVDLPEDGSGDATDVAFDDGTMWTVAFLWLIRGQDEPQMSEGLGQLAEVEVAPDGAVWVSAPDEWEIYAAGVASFRDGQWTTYREGESLPVRDMSGLAVAPDGTVWVGSRWSGLASFDGSSWTRYDVATYPGLGGIERVSVGPDGVVWVASQRGVTRFDGVTWTWYTTADGLASNAAHDVAVADDGTVWVATAAGLQRLSA